MKEKLNKSGFTLMEVLTVIVVITALMMITIPLIGSITEKNQKELYHSYETMMEEYAKASKIKDKDKIMLSELDGLKEIKKECEGYVSVTNNPRNYHAYIKCGDKYESDVSEDNVDEPVSTIPSCPGCKFIYTENTYYYFGPNQSTMTDVTINNDVLYNDYTKLNKNKFLGFIFENDILVRAYICGIKPGEPNDGVPFCLEVTNDGSAYESNAAILNDPYTGIWKGTCQVSNSSPKFYVNCSANGVFTARVGSDGNMYIDVFSEGGCSGNTNSVHCSN